MWTAGDTSFFRTHYCLFNNTFQFHIIWFFRFIFCNNQVIVILIQHERIGGYSWFMFIVGQPKSLHGSSAFDDDNAEVLLHSTDFSISLMINRISCFSWEQQTSLEDLLFVADLSFKVGGCHSFNVWSIRGVDNRWTQFDIIIMRYYTRQYISITRILFDLRMW